MNQIAFIIYVLLAVLIISPATALGSDDIFESSLYSHTQTIRVNPYTHVAATRIEERVSYKIPVNKNIWNVVSQIVVYNKRTGSSRHYPARKPSLESKSISSKEALLTTEHQCDGGGNNCYVTITHPVIADDGINDKNGLLRITASLHDDLGALLLSKDIEIQQKHFPADFFLKDHFYAKYDVESHRVVGVMRDGPYFHEANVKLVITSNNKTDSIPYSLHKGQMFDYDVPTDTSSIAVEVSSMLSSDHVFKATYRLWDSRDPFYVRPRDRWSAILGKRLFHNDMGVSL